jgi:hypothetical protein
VLSYDRCAICSHAVFKLGLAANKEKRRRQQVSSHRIHNLAS